MNDLFGYTQADEMMEKARKWRTENWDLYQRMLYLAVRDMEQGGRSSIAYYFEVARKELKVTGLLNNTLRDPIVRLMIQDAPGLEGHFETRRSKCDLV